MPEETTILDRILDRLQRELPDSWWIHAPDCALAVATAGAEWFAVHTRPGCEPAVNRLLRDKGFETFYPYLLVMRWRRLQAGRSQRQEEVKRPYLPRYMFARCGREHVGIVNRVVGVSTVVHINGEPLRIPDTVMGVFLDLAEVDGRMAKDDRTRRARSFRGKIGDRARLLEPSPLAGLVGVIVSIKALDGKGEIGLFLEMFGGRREITVPAEHIEVSAAA